MKNGKPLGKTVEPDYENEKLFRERAIKTAREKTANSGRVLAGGGLAVALANEAISSGVGMNISIKPQTTVESLLFSEGGARAIYSVPNNKIKEFENTWNGFSFDCIGTATGDSLSWDNLFTIPISDISKAFLEGE
jgi:phosphoribosylformylglycinamidine synthase